MPETHTALSVDVEEDLLPLSALLHQRGLRHRVFEEGGRQVLKVQRRDEAEQVAALILAEFQVPWLRLTLAKPGAVRQAREVGVIIERGERP